MLYLSNQVKVATFEPTVEHNFFLIDCHTHRGFFLHLKASILQVFIGKFGQKSFIDKLSKLIEVRESEYGDLLFFVKVEINNFLSLFFLFIFDGVVFPFRLGYDKRFPLWFFKVGEWIFSFPGGLEADYLFANTSHLWRQGRVRFIFLWLWLAVGVLFGLGYFWLEWFDFLIEVLKAFPFLVIILHIN